MGLKRSLVKFWTVRTCLGSTSTFHTKVEIHIRHVLEDAYLWFSSCLCRYIFLTKWNQWFTRVIGPCSNRLSRHRKRHSRCNTNLKMKGTRTFPSGFNTSLRSITLKVRLMLRRLKDTSISTAWSSSIKISNRSHLTRPSTMTYKTGMYLVTI